MNWHKHTDEIRTKLSPLVAPGTEFPVAVLDNALAQALGVTSRTVWMSDDTLLKQIIEHEPEGIGMSHYYQVQQTIEQASLITEDKKANHYAVIKMGEQYLMALLKIT